MSTPLHVLILEDQPADAELMLYELRQAGFAPESYVVETEPDYLAHLEPLPDLILADYSLPQFDALRALQLLKEQRSDIPFIVVTGTLSDEVAVECVKQGAADYLLKDRLARLGPSVMHALERKRLWEAKSDADRALLEAEERWSAFVENVPDHFVVLDLQGTILFANGIAQSLTREKVVGTNLYDYIPRDQHHLLRQAMENTLQTGATASNELSIVSTDGTTTWWSNRIRAINSAGKATGFVAIGTDITEQKSADETLWQSERYVTAGDQLREQGNLEEAVANYSQAIRLNPELAVAYNNRGTTFAVLGQLQRAIQDLDQALRIDPEYVDAYNNRGYAYVSLGRFQKAIEDYDEAIGLDPHPQFSVVYNNRGYACAAVGELERAIADFDEAIRLNPQDAVAYNHRALACALSGKHAEAQRDADRAAELGADATPLKE